MSVQVLYDPEMEQAAIYCNTTDLAFGPIFNDNGSDGDGPMLDAGQVAWIFLNWLDKDARQYVDQSWDNLRAKFLLWLEGQPTDADFEELKESAEAEVMT